MTFEFFYNDFALFILRFAVGVVFVSHGLSKIMKGENLLGKKYAWASAVLGTLELVGGVMAISGLWMRAVAVVLAAVMIGAMYFHIVVWRNGFRGGWDMPFLLFVVSISLALTGGGNWRIII